MARLMAHWEGLHHDLLVLIVKKLNLIEDFAAFGTVCKSWHAAAATNKQPLRRSQAPWLMFPAREAEDERQIFSLSKHDRLTKNVYIPEMHTKLCIGLNYGWFLISSDVRDITLVHPLSRAQIPLPPRQAMFEGPLSPNSLWIIKAALSANPSESPLDFVLMVVHSHKEDLHYWRPGHERWTKARRRPGCSSGYNDLCYHDNQFHAINKMGQVWSWTDLGPHRDPIFARCVTKISWSSTRAEVSRSSTRANTYGGNVCKYVVPGSGPGSLFVVIRFRDEVVYTKESLYNCRRKDRDGIPAIRMKMWFKVYEVDLMKGRNSEIESLGDRAIFVGRNTSMALENASQYPGVKPNHIHFTSDYIFRWEKEVGCYNIENGETTHFEVDASTPFRHFWPVTIAFQKPKLVTLLGLMLLLYFVPLLQKKYLLHAT